MSAYTSPTSPRIAITMGDVNGVGPEILAKALARKEIQDLATYTIYGDERVFAEANALLAQHIPHVASFNNAGMPAPTVEPGRLSGGAGACAHAWIVAATKATHGGEADALVTCPVNKEAMQLAGHPDLGHTELLERLLDAPDWRMCLYAKQTLVVHLSGHLSLRAALDAVSTDAIVNSTRMAHAALLRIGIAQPRIAVAGLNPHAGEHGLIGHEDDAIIAPAVRICSEEGILCTGPCSPDAVFRQLWQGAFDAVIAMYHDQGHIAMKMVAMDEGVSLTLGLPIVRTSPDHGTAFDIAWSGTACEDSLCAAIELAASLASPAPKDP